MGHYKVTHFLLVFFLVFSFTLGFKGLAAAAETRWTGLGDDRHWSDPNNWSNGIPVNGSDIRFSGTLTENESMINDIANLSLGRITLTGNANAYDWKVVSGNSIKLSEGIFDTTTGQEGAVGGILVNKVATSNLIFKTRNTDDRQLAIGGLTNIGRYNLFLNSLDEGEIFAGHIKGTGRVVINGNSHKGVYMVGKTIAAPIVIQDGGVLRGSGKVSRIKIMDGGKLRPEVDFQSRNLDIDGLLDSYIPRVEYDLGFVVYGTVDVSGANLMFSQRQNFSYPRGQKLRIIGNDGTDPVRGRFNGKPEGALCRIGNYTFRITYYGGSGNDIVLTRL
jgi:hypothetical protein